MQKSFFLQDAEIVARELLGCVLVRNINGNNRKEGKDLRANKIYN